MNQLYIENWSYHIKTTNDEEISLYRSMDYGAQIHYGQMPNDYDEPSKYRLMTKKKLFSKKKYIETDIGAVGADEVQDLILRHEYHPVTFQMTMNELGEQLPSEEYIQYLKDNGIGCVMINKT